MVASLALFPHVSLMAKRRCVLVILLKVLSMHRSMIHAMIVTMIILGNLRSFNSPAPRRRAEI